MSYGRGIHLKTVRRYSRYQQTSCKLRRTEKRQTHPKASSARTPRAKCHTSVSRPYKTCHPSVPQGNKRNDPGGTRTHDPWFRRPMPYPLGHGVLKHHLKGPAVFTKARVMCIQMHSALI